MSYCSFLDSPPPLPATPRLPAVVVVVVVESLAVVVAAAMAVAELT